MDFLTAVLVYLQIMAPSGVVEVWFPVVDMDACHAVAEVIFSLVEYDCIPLAELDASA